MKTAVIKHHDLLEVIVLQFSSFLHCFTVLFVQLFTHIVDYSEKCYISESATNIGNNLFSYGIITKLVIFFNKYIAILTYFVIFCVEYTEF